MSSLEGGALIHDIFVVTTDFLLVRVAEVLAKNILLASDQVLRRGHTVYVAFGIELVSEVCGEGPVSKAT